MRKKSNKTLKSSRCNKRLKHKGGFKIKKRTGIKNKVRRRTQRTRKTRNRKLQRNRRTRRTRRTRKILIKGGGSSSCGTQYALAKGIDIPESEFTEGLSIPDQLGKIGHQACPPDVNHPNVPQ